MRALRDLDRVVLPAFFGANALLTLWLIRALGVQAPRYFWLPWIFFGAFGLLLVPAVRRQVTAGPWPWRLAPPLVYAGVISLASSVNPAAPTGLSGNVFHPVEFAGLALLAQLAAHGGLVPPPRWRRVALAALICVAFGVVDEVHQSFVPRRAATALDVGLDALGTLLGTAVYLGGHALAARLTGSRRRA